MTSCKNRLKIAQKRLEIARAGIKSQLAPQEAEVDQKRAAYELRVRQLEDLKVKAGMDGVLQVVPVEVGAQVSPGTNLAASPTPPTSRLNCASRKRRRRTSRSARSPKSIPATASSRAASRGSTRRRTERHCRRRHHPRRRSCRPAPGPI